MTTRPYTTGLERHQHPFNRGIHLIGIPLALAGVVLFFVLPWEQWYWGTATFVGGYLLQWIGHLVEGNDLGEWAGIKRLLGWPYVAVSPRWTSNANHKSAKIGKHETDDDR